MRARLPGLTSHGNASVNPQMRCALELRYVATVISQVCHPRCLVEFDAEHVADVGTLYLHNLEEGALCHNECSAHLGKLLRVIQCCF